MQNVLLTIIGPYRNYDLELPGDVPIRDLLPLLVDICGPVASSMSDYASMNWCLRVAGGYRTLSDALSLNDAGVLNGIVLHLQEVSSQAEEPLPETGFRTRTIAPGPDTGGIGIHWDRKGFSS